MHFLVIVGMITGSVGAFQQMNGEYKMANSKGAKAQHRGDGYFELESDVYITQYATVNWDVRTVPIPDDVQKKLDGKLINFVGYEFDIIRVLDNGTERSAHAWEVYNHHYANTIMGKGMSLVKTGVPHDHEDPMDGANTRSRFPGYKIVEQNPPNNKRPLDGDGPAPCGGGTPTKCVYTAYPGAIAADVSNVAGPLNLTTAQAEAMCSKTATCSGFTYEGQQAACATTVCKTYLKTNADWTASNTDPTWNTYTKYPRAARPQGAKYGSQGLIMGNGAESRKTFHYFSPGYGAQVFSPTQAVLHPMLIDTTNREPKTDPATDPGHGRHGIVPMASNAAPEDMYSGLMECPCTDKWEKVISSYSTLKEGTCQPDITTADDCYTAAQELGLRPAKQNSTVSNAKLPPGCSVAATVGGFDVIFNTAKSTVTCGDPAATKGKSQPRVAGLAENLVNISVDLNPATDLATITLQGPSDVWFGVGLGAHGKFNPADPSSGLSMYGTNWTIVVLADGTVAERDLGNHEPGTQLPQSVKVVSTTVKDGSRTIVMTRSIEGNAIDNMRFDPSANSMPFINAIGNDDQFSHGHQLKATGVMYFVETEYPTCLCDVATDQGTLGGYAWGGQRCAAKPLSEMMDDPAFPENNNVNPTCLLKSYKGGLRCCKGGTVLLDKNQTVPQTNNTFKLKYRYYYEIGSQDPKKVQDTFQCGWFTEHANNEHDVPLCKSKNKTECTYTITSNLTASDLGGPCKSGTGCKMITMEGHCHIGCLKMELWIVDDPANPKLLCRTKVDYGKTDGWMDEVGYIGGAETCIFGDPSKGYAAPIVLTPDTKIMSISVQNSTHARYGDMALWELNAAYVTAEDLAADATVSTV